MSYQPKHEAKRAVTRRLPLWSVFILVSFLIHACKANTAPDPGIIAFLSERDGIKSIYLISSDGSNIVRLETGLVEDGCPVWSPDGSQIMFVSANGTDLVSNLHRELNIYIVNEDGSNLTQLTHGESEIYDASWSPDGSRIVYSADPLRIGRHNIYMTNVDGSGTVQITHSPSRDLDPVWSPDGHRILFSSNPTSEPRTENMDYDLYVMDTDGSNQIRLVDNPEVGPTVTPPEEFGAVWSPLGDRIAYYSRYLDDSFSMTANIFVMEADGTNTTQLTASRAPVKNGSPTWSPDGQYLAFTSNRDGVVAPETFNIYTMRADGSDLTRLTSVGSNYCPAWRP